MKTKNNLKLPAVTFLGGANESKFHSDWSGVLQVEYHDEQDEITIIQAVEVIDICASISEAQEAAQHHYGRLDPDEDACPSVYVYHARQQDGSFAKVASWVL